jgi:hypothetical protein
VGHQQAARRQRDDERSVLDLEDPREPAARGELDRCAEPAGPGRSSLAGDGGEEPDDQAGDVCAAEKPVEQAID